MTQLKENTVEASKEKHIPVVEKVEGGIKVKVGSVAHPMMGDKAIIRPLSPNEPVCWGIKPLNKEQRFALELLLDDNINLITLIGNAGTGKTLISLAAGLHKALDENTYRRLIICRSIVPVGRDIGFLPGSKEEKLGVWMGAINDNLEFLASKKHVF